MEDRTDGRVIHSYDTEHHRVLCGVQEQTGSTKHASGVTCTTCREMLRDDDDRDNTRDVALEAGGR
jgi:hypothetical protein